MLFKFRFLGLITIAAVAGMWPLTAQAAATAPGLGSASRFAVLSAAPGGLGAVKCTDGTIFGAVGSSGARASVVQTRCSIHGAIVAPVSTQVVRDFNTAYAGYAAIICGETLHGTLAGIHRGPGVYCVDAVEKTGTFFLDGPSTGTWIFKVAATPPTTPPTGALTGTNFNVVMAGGGLPCNVNWQVAQAATMTTSNFTGTILAGAAITLTGGTFHGSVLAKAGVTITGTSLLGCNAAGVPGQGCKDEDEDGAHHGDGDDHGDGDEHQAARHADDSEGSRHGDDSEGCDSEDSHQGGDSEDSHQGGDSEDSHQGGEDHKVSVVAKVETHDSKTETKSINTHKSTVKSTVKATLKSKSDSESKSESESD